METLEERSMLATVTTHLDVTNPTDGLTSLREAIINTLDGGTVDFAPSLNGFTIELNRDVIAGYGQISFAKSLTIDGRDSNGVSLNITIDGNDPSASQFDGIRIFNIIDSTNGATPPEVEMIGLTLQGADGRFSFDDSEWGGAIGSQGILTLRDMKIVDNEGYVGGGVYVAVAGSGSDPRTVLRIETSEFQNNSAAQNGGGIGVKLRGSGQDIVEIVDSTLTGNKAEGSGGGLYIIGGSASAGHEVIITASHIVGDNRAITGNGGAIFSTIAGTNFSILQGSSISGNRTTSGITGMGNGGGLYILADGGSDIVIEQSTLSGNVCTGRGGALSAVVLEASSLRIKGSVVSGNTAEYDGGGMFLSAIGGSVFIEESSVVSGNTTTLGNGGGLNSMCEYGGQLTIDDSTIDGNRSMGFDRLAAGAYLRSDDGFVTVTDTTISANRAVGEESNLGGLGIIAVNGSTVLVDQAKITGNHSDDDVGGLYIRNIDSAVTVTRSTISGNTASHNSPASGTHPDFINAASGVWLRAEDSGSEPTTTTIEYSTISGNEIVTGPDGIKQNVDGAGFFIQCGVDTTTLIRNTTISGNLAEGSGGGIKVAEVSDQYLQIGGELLIEHSTITQNRANSDDYTSGSGGGIHVGNSSTLVTLNHTIVAGNFRGTGTTRDDIVGPVTATWSLIGDSTGATITDNGGNQTGDGMTPIDPGLEEELADNGGPTATHALEADSLALDRGNPSAVPGANGVPVFDQRGDGFTRKFGSRIDIGAYELQAPVDTTAPTIIDVLLDGVMLNPDTGEPLGMDWMRDPYSFAAAVPFGKQLAPVYILGVNKIQIAFSEHVLLEASDLTLYGSNFNSFDPLAIAPTGYAYNSDTYVATWTFPLADLDGDKYRIDLVGTITDAAGNILDGEWTHSTNGTGDKLIDDVPETFPSGNGVEGTDDGMFQFRFAILPGDYNQDGIVNGADYVIWGSASPVDGDGNGTAGDAGDFDVWTNNFMDRLVGGKWMGDYNDDERVDHLDFLFWRERFGGTNPSQLEADGNGNGVVDAPDYVIWRKYHDLYNYGSAWQMDTSGSGTSQVGAAPTVINVTLSGANSAHDPYSFENVVGSGEQLRTVPVGNVDTVSITFSEAVNVIELDLWLVGLRTANVPTLLEFSYNAATMTATWRFDDLVANDQYVISLSDAVSDGDGNFLDGEWTNPAELSTINALVSEFPSGDGQAGGAFNFVVTLLAADANRDNLVDGADYDIWQSHWAQDGGFVEGDFGGDGIVGSEDLIYWEFTDGVNRQDVSLLADLNGDFTVNDFDLDILRDNMGMSDPTLADGDLNGDGSISFADLDLALAQFGSDFEVLG
jgi:hypothetical protein